MGGTWLSLKQFSGALPWNNNPHLTILSTPTNLPAKPSLQQPQDPALSILRSLTSAKVAGLHTSPGAVCSTSKGPGFGGYSSHVPRFVPKETAIREGPPLTFALSPVWSLSKKELAIWGIFLQTEFIKGKERSYRNSWPPINSFPLDSMCISPILKTQRILPQVLSPPTGLAVSDAGALYRNYR